MDENDYLKELDSHSPVELLGKYSKEIDEFILKNTPEIKKETFLLSPEKRNFFIPLMINISAVLLILAGLFFSKLFFNIQEQNIISNYAVLNTVEGRLLLEYKQETEEKLRLINGEISKIEQRLLNVTDEKNKLVSEIDMIVSEKQKELEARMASELEEERENLLGQGLSGQEIEDKLKTLETAKLIEINEQKEELRSELEEEYKMMQADYQELLDEYESTLKQVQTQREYLEKELEDKNAELENLSKHIGKTDSEEQITKENTELTSLNEEHREEELIKEQIESFYNKIMVNMENSNFTEAKKNLAYLTEYLNEDTISGIPSVLERKEFDQFLLFSLKRLIDFETKPYTIQTDTEDLNTTEGSKTEPDTIAEDKKPLLERIKYIENKFETYFKENPGILKTTSEDEFIDLVEVKLLVKEILNSEPVSAEYPGISDKLEEYYSALGNEKTSTGKYYALLNVLDLLESMESNSSIIRHDWENLDNNDLKSLFLQIIRKLENLLE